MENALKEIFGALNSRVKSHLFGAVVIFSFIFNWKPIFFLLFSNVSVSSKFVYFDANTDLWSLYVCPISAATIFVLAAPFVNEKFHRIVSEPAHRMKLRDLTLAEEREAQKFALRQADKQRHADETRRLEQEALEQAKFDSRVQDEELRPEIAEDLQKQIDELRNRPAIITDAGTVGENDAERISSSLSPFSKKLLIGAVSNNARPEIRVNKFLGGAEITYGKESIRQDKLTDRKWQEYRYSINELERYELVKRVGGGSEVWNVSPKGYQVADLLT